MASKLKSVMVRLTKEEEAQLNKFREGPAGAVPAGAAIKYLMMKELERIERANTRRSKK